MPAREDIISLVRRMTLSLRAKSGYTTASVACQSGISAAAFSAPILLTS